MSSADDPYYAEMKRALRDALAACGEATTDDEAAVGWNRFRDAALRFGLSTSENVAALDRIDFGESRGEDESARKAGLRLRASGYLLTDLLWRLEDEPIPATIREELPDLMPEDWSAALRLTTMLALSFERKTGPGESSEPT